MILSSGDGRGDMVMISTGDGRGDMVIYLPYDPGDYVGMLVSEQASGRLYRCVEVVREETTICAEVSADEAEW
jgi:hypothetical protein